MRPARLRASLRSNSFVLPALVCAGFVIGLAGAFWKNGGIHGDASARSPSETPSPFAVRDEANRFEDGVATEQVDDGGFSGGAAVADAQASSAEWNDADLRLTESSDESAVDVDEPESEQVAYYAPDPPGAPNADERASVIRAVDTSDAEGGSASVAALQSALTSDRSVRNRLLAINSLRTLAKQGRDLPHVREILRTAMSDSDSNVATSARDAFKELTR
jgi:hypothetical protein